MKILIVGANGTVGCHVVEQALERGHEVVAIARNSAKLKIEHSKLTKASVDILDAAAIEPLLVGIDAVISAVGIGTSKVPTEIYSSGTRNLINGMTKHGVERIVVISSEVADHWAHQGAFKLWVVLPLLQRLFGSTYDDMRRMDTVLWGSGVEWTAVRSPRIQRSKAKGRYRLDAGKPLRRGWIITAPDMATALLDISESNELGKHHVFVSN